LNDKRIFVSKDDQQHAIVTVSGGKKGLDYKFGRKLFLILSQGVVPSVRYLDAPRLIWPMWREEDLKLLFSWVLAPMIFAAGVLLVQEAGGKNYSA